MPRKDKTLVVEGGYVMCIATIKTIREQISFQLLYDA